MKYHEWKNQDSNESPKTGIMKQKSRGLILKERMQKNSVENVQGKGWLVEGSNHTDVPTTLMRKNTLLAFALVLCLRCLLYLFFEQEKPTVYPSRPNTNVTTSKKSSLLLETRLVILSTLCSITLHPCSKGTHLSFSSLKDKCCVIHYLFIWRPAQFLTYSRHCINVNFYHHDQQNSPSNFWIYPLILLN